MSDARPGRTAAQSSTGARRRALLGVAALTALTAVLAVSARAPSGADASASAAAEARYAVLERPARANDAARLSRAYAAAQARRPIAGLRPAAARVVDLDARTRAVGPTTIVRVVPASDVPCLYRQNADGTEGMSCGRDGTSTAVVGYDGAYGLVSDEVESVSFTMSDGSRRTGAVTDNVWTSPLEAAKVAYVERGKVVEIDLMPRSSLPAGMVIGADGMVRPE